MYYELRYVELELGVRLTLNIFVVDISVGSEISVIKLGLGVLVSLCATEMSLFRARLGVFVDF